jgi:hypothetical protein
MCTDLTNETVDHFVIVCSKPEKVSEGVEDSDFTHSFFM